MIEVNSGVELGLPFLSPRVGSLGASALCYPDFVPCEKGGFVNRRIIDLYDEYTHAPLDRRVFMARLAQLVGGTAAAAAILPLLEPGYAHAALVAADDARIESNRITYKGASGEVKATIARPKDGKKFPAMIVIHENRGLNAHIEDVTRRLGVAGFLALAPDLLSGQGGTPADADKAREMIGQLEAKVVLGDLTAAVAMLESHELGNGKVGAVGFCWGGGMVGQLAVASPALDAGVVYYGRTPASEDVAKIEAPLLLHYAGLDERINQGVPAFEESLKKGKKKYTLHMYEGVNHAFHNDTSEARYDKTAAELSWSRTIEFLMKQLQG